MIISINVIPIIIHYIYHHKSWQILSIFMEAMASELLVSYVKSHYLSFTSGAWVFVTLTNLWLRQVLLIASPSMYSELGSGETINVLSMPPKQFSPLFFGLNMPIYIETHIRDSFLRIQCPDKLRKFLEDNESYSGSGNNSKGKGVILFQKQRTKEPKCGYRVGFQTTTSG